MFLQDIIQSKVTEGEWASLSDEQRELLYADINGIILEEDRSALEAVTVLIKRIRPASLLTYVRTLQA
jgi:hypothetical protein